MYYCNFFVYRKLLSDCIILNQGMSSLIFVIMLDIDECLEKSNHCDSNANCTNTDGSYKCKCSQGYRGNGQNCTGKYVANLFFHIHLYKNHHVFPDQPEAVRDFSVQSTFGAFFMHHYFNYFRCWRMLSAKPYMSFQCNMYQHSRFLRLSV